MSICRSHYKQHLLNEFMQFITDKSIFIHNCVLLCYNKQCFNDMILKDFPRAYFYSGYTEDYKNESFKAEQNTRTDKDQ